MYVYVCLSMYVFKENCWVIRRNVFSFRINGQTLKWLNQFIAPAYWGSVSIARIFPTLGIVFIF